MTNKYLVSIASVAAIIAATGLGVSANEISTEVKAEAQGQVRIQDSNVPALETKGETGVEANSERVLPTVNKKTAAKVTVRGWDVEKKEQIEAKIQAALENNPQINSLEVSENSVLVNYGATAKLLGFIPVTMPITVTADADAKVKVKFPWWKFMASSNFSNTAELLNGVFQNNQTDLEFLLKKAS